MSLLKCISKVCGHFTFPIFSLHPFMLYQKVIHRRKDEEMKKRKKRKKVKILSTGGKIINWHFSKYLNLADFKYAFRFFISSLDQRLQPSGVGLFWPNLMVFFCRFSSTPRGCNFKSEKDTKNLNADFKLARFKYSKKCQFIIFQLKKIVIFFFFIFKFFKKFFSIELFFSKLSFQLSNIA